MNVWTTFGTTTSKSSKITKWTSKLNIFGTQILIVRDKSPCLWEWQGFSWHDEVLPESSFFPMQGEDLCGSVGKQNRHIMHGRLFFPEFWRIWMKQKLQLHTLMFICFIDRQSLLVITLESRISEPEIVVFWKWLYNNTQPACKGLSSQRFSCFPRFCSILQMKNPPKSWWTSHEWHQHTFNFTWMMNVMIP